MCEQVIAKQSDIHSLGRAALDRRMRALLTDDRHVEVEFLRYLDEFDQQRGWAAFGLTTLWDYCTRELGLRSGATYRRTHAMFVLRRFPEVAEMLRDGRLCVTTLTILEKWLTNENAETLFRDASGKSTRYVEEEIVAKLKARIVPTEEVRELEKKLAPISPVAAEARRGEVEAAGGTVAAASSSVDPKTEKAVEERLGSMTVVLLEEEGENGAHAVSADQFQVTMTVSREWVETYRQLATRLPVKSLAEITHYCMRETAKRIAKRDGTEMASTPGESETSVESASTSNTEPENLAVGKEGSDYIPIELQQAVRRRDGNRCQWLQPDGAKCLSPDDLQFDHIREKARGGKTEYKNLQMLCPGHNQQKAMDAFGEEFIAAKIRERRAAEALRKMQTSSLPAPEVSPEERPPPPD